MKIKSKQLIIYVSIILLIVLLSVMFTLILTKFSPIIAFILIFFIFAFTITSIYIHVLRVVSIISRSILNLEKHIQPSDDPFRVEIDKNPFLNFQKINQLFIHYDDVINKTLFEQEVIETKLKDLERINIFKNHTLDTLLKVNHLFLNLSDSNDYYDILLKSAIEVIENASKGSLLLFNNETNTYKYHTCVGYDLKELQKVTMTLEETFLYKNSIGNYEDPIIIRNMREFDLKSLDSLRNESIEKAGGMEIEEVLSAPIVIDGQIFAIINIDSVIPNAFDEVDQQLIHFFASQIAIALKNKYLVDETVNMSRYDKLTGAYNRNYFEKILTDHREHALESLEPYAIVLCDLNYLKLINDSFGHSAGDAILREFSRMITSSIRESDVLSRIGGDEFVILLRNISLAHAEEKMSQVFEKIKDHRIEYQGSDLPVSFSYGISASPDDSMIYDILVKIADIRMYKFKEKYKSENPKLLSIINTM
ncbi:sensor domain-containing diguanylate cyclase [Fusibacter bizertensis]